jgi:AraC-like DNA-binding protein
MSYSFDVNSLDPADRLSTWHDVLWRNYVPLNIKTGPASSSRFAGKVSTSDVARLRIATSWSPVAHTISRTPRLIAGDEQSVLMLGRQAVGRGRVSQQGRESTLDVGDFVLWETRSPYEIEFLHEWKMQVFQFPREYVNVSDEFVQRLVGRAFSMGDGFNRGVSRYLGALADDVPDGDPSGNEIAASTLDLILTALERVSKLPVKGGLHADTRRRILAYVDAYREDPGLNVGSVAKAFGVSTRQLHRFFADHDLTLGEEIRGRRLASIKRELASRRNRDRTIATIAANWGYLDAPHFSREFRRFYGISPSRWRAQAASTGEEPQ